MEWKDGKLTTATFHSARGSEGTLSYAGKKRDLKIPAGGKVTLKGSEL